MLVETSEVLRDAAPAGEASLSANCDGNRAPGAVTEEIGWGRFCLLRAASLDAMVRHYELEALAEAAQPYHESAEKRAEAVTFNRGLADSYRKHAAEYRRMAREAGEKIPAPCMSGFIAAVGGRP